MADHLLFIGWKFPHAGREERSLEVFNEAIGLLGRMQQDGRIESFDVAIMAPNTDLGGYMQARGTADQIDALRRDEAFTRMTIDAEVCVDGLRHLEGFTGDALARRTAMFQEASGKVKQFA